MRRVREIRKVSSPYRPLPHFSFMKRALATLASVVTLLSFSSPALARNIGDYTATRNQQPRLDQRSLKSAALATYRGRHNRAYTRARYNALVQRMMPSLLAVTGRDERRSDSNAVSRPGTREIGGSTNESLHCSSPSGLTRKCGGENH